MRTMNSDIRVRNRSMRFYSLIAGVALLALLASFFASLVPFTVSASTSIFSDSFGTGGTDSTFNETPSWTEGGAGAEKRAIGSGNDSASPSGGRFAVMFGTDFGSAGYICRTIDATGYTNVQLSYEWRGDSDANHSSDNGLVEIRTGGSCSSSSGWTLLKNHDLQQDASWTTESPFTNAGMTGSFLLRFRVEAEDAENFRVDNVHVTGDVPNTAPVATDSSVSVNENTSVLITLDATDADPLTFATTTNPTNGTLGLISGNQVTYTPNTDYVGPDSFSFTASDGLLTSNVATVTIDVDNVNAAPAATDMSITTAFEAPITDTLLATDADLDVLTFATTSDPVSGTLVLNSATGEFTYTPNGGFSGSDSFTFKANDGLADSNVATVTITVDPAPVAPASSGGGGGGGGGIVSGPFSIGFVNTNPAPQGQGGQVLGAETELPSGCMPYLNQYLRMGNSGSEVSKLQAFLNKELTLSLEVDGTFGQSTLDAVKAFQLKYWEEILAPWVPFGLTNAQTPTGYVYKTTNRMISLIECGAGAVLPMPQLP